MSGRSITTLKPIAVPSQGVVHAVPDRESNQPKEGERADQVKDDDKDDADIKHGHTLDRLFRTSGKFEAGPAWAVD